MGLATATPATMADLHRSVVALFQAIGDGTDLLFGKGYLSDFGAGHPPRVLFVPGKNGKAGPPLHVGGREVASVTQACMVLVRGAEDGTDIGRSGAADALTDRVVNAIKASAPGRITMGSFGDSSPLPVDAYGAEDTFSFLFRRPVYEDAQIMAAAFAEPQTSPPAPDQPQGDTGLAFSTGTITANTTRTP